MRNPYEPLNLYSNFQASAERFPEVPIYFDEPLAAFPELKLETTYMKCAQAIIQKASLLKERGIQKQDKIIIYKSPKFDTYLLAVAASYLGAVPAMISYHLPVETMNVLAERLDFPYILFDEETAEKAHQMENIPEEKLIRAEELGAASETTPVSQEKLALDEISYMTHTSGTTGIPKLIAHSTNSMGFRTQWQRNVLSLIREKKLAAFHISPVHSRFNIGISSLMSQGFPLFPIAQPDEANIEHIMTTYQPYIVETHPNNFVQWVNLAREKPETFASIRYFHSTFDAINKETMAVFLNCSKEHRPVFMQVYGQSECGPMILRFHTKQSIQKIDARNMGYGMKNLTDVRIVSEDGEVVPNGTPGNIQMLSKGRALTYYKEDARFNENVYGPFWDSGDYGMKNEAGALLLLDRQVDLVENIESTLAIEDKLLDTLSFLNEVVIIRGKNGTPQPIISVASGREMDWEAWYGALSDLPQLNEPILMAYDDIPRTATMKVQRLKMEKELNA
ncbi:AMP-binding protein [Listeria aquatica]|uniref:Long-chain acyl-CoA synthetase n=1 Tax=Listeria aquatica FSL S10-1188 TaxID=1265818 RepID=W7BP88_9LIST|nr:acyl-CoA synthetase [Listeria aquatica]EUJ21858.1 long-chain acyl-CoA synthetase [Listeria aquatica FSL S10-1188]